MKITIVQTHLHWEKREKNLEHFDGLINSIGGTDLIVLPEMFTTGFTMNPEQLAEPANGETLNWLKKKAVEKKSIITGSVSVSENANYYNRLYWVDPSQEVKTYNKRHLFRMAKEDEHYTAGRSKLLVKAGEWIFCPLICYDLRFPVWCRNVFDKQNGIWSYDALVFVANWPEVRSYAWRQLLIARAIENQCYVIGVNRTGPDGNNFAHSGDSMVINPKGEVISKMKSHEEGTETIQLDLHYLQEFRKIFPAGMDADDFTISNRRP